MIRMIEVNSIKDIHNLIQNQVEENLYLDYKSADALLKTDGKKKEIAKDVSAFANSDGGMIIYGVKEYNEMDKKHLPEKVDPINRVNISKEWLEHVINSNIFPRIEGITILPITVNPSKNEVIYVVTIPKSNSAHQGSDYRYYKRFNFESVAMYDFEIRDVMNRNKFPKIDLDFEIEQFSYESDNSIQMSFLNQEQNTNQIETFNTLNVYGHNIGGIYANYVNCHLEIPFEILDEKKYDHLDKYLKNEIEYVKIYCDNTIREVKDVTTLMNSTYYKYWPSRYDPILPGTNSRLTEVNLRNKNIYSGKIYWKINADNAEQLLGEINVEEIIKFKKKE